jgi:hypothetical protein
MNFWTSILYAFSLASLLLAGCQQKSTPTYYKVGAAVANITPQIGAFIAGDANGRRFEGVHDSLYIKTIVVSDKETSIALISVDCIGLLYPTLLKIREAVAQQVAASEFQPDHIVLTSTHTHSGPDVVGIWGPAHLVSGVDSAYMNELVHKAAQTVLLALKNRQEALAYSAEGTHGEDWVVNISDSLSVDRSLNLMQFRDKNGKSIASLLNFGCHPTFLDNANELVSADYVGGVYHQMDEQLGGVNLFLQGAIGGWVQPEYEEKTFQNAEKRGRALAEKGLELLQKSRPMQATSLSYKRKQIQLPVSNPVFQQLSALGVLDRPVTNQLTTEIAWFTIGNAPFATHPGETTPMHALQTKALMPGQGPKFVIGLGMDALGYILSPNFFDPNNPLKHTDYMLSMSIDPEAGPVLLQRLSELALEQR